MKKRLLSLTCTIIVILYASSCVALSEPQKQQYETLKSAVILSKMPVRGKFGNNIPPEFNAEEFLEVVKNNIPADKYEVLENYKLQVIPKGSYYLIKVFDPETNSLILFFYSCDKGEKGWILDDPGKYDINHIELYDNCKTTH